MTHILIQNYTVAIVAHLRGEKMNKAILLTLLVMMTAFSGCLNDSEDSEPLPAPLYTSEHSSHDSYQFNNYAPMGMGNSTQVLLNATNMTVIVEVNVTAGFHEPLLWDQGSVNVSILDNNETVLWSNESNGGQDNYTYVVADNFSYNGNITLRIMADGSDNATDGEVADWYVVRWDVCWEWSDI